MYNEHEVLVFDFARAISEAVDLASPSLNHHHKRVAYIADSIARGMDLPNDRIQDIALASMLHDVGAFSKEEWDLVGSFESYETNDSELNRHAYLGYKLLKQFGPLAGAAELIKHHHADFRRQNFSVPIGSYIIRLADRVSVLIDDQREILGQAGGIIEAMKQNRDVFHPEPLTVLDQLAKQEYFWIEAFSPFTHTDMAQRARLFKGVVDIKMLRDFAVVIAQTIDFRSRFTASHSSGVAIVARELAALAGFSEKECMLMEIAGFLHDLGKLSVPSEILEKNGKLTGDEVDIIRKHTYYTYSILSRIRGLEQIASWAAYHHERLDGKGYPFHIKGEDFSKPARIMAVADVLTALTEDRPYRSGLGREETEKILLGMVDNGGLDGTVVEMVGKNFPLLNWARGKAQEEAQERYAAFIETVPVGFGENREMIA